MTWNNWLFGRKAPTGPRPSVQDVTFTAMPMRLEKQGPDFIEWRDADNDRVVAAVDRASPLIPWTLDELRTHCRLAAASRNGGIVSVTFVRPADVPVAQAICKFPEGSGYRYEGTVMIRFREALYRLTLEASEHGMTGGREAMTSALLVPLGVLKLPVVVPPAQSAELEGWKRDPYDDGYTGPTLHALSDDERLDELMPDHALSKVRGWLDAVGRTIAIPVDLRSDIVDVPPAEYARGESQHRIPTYAVGILYLQAGRPDIAARLLAEGMSPGSEPDITAPSAGRHLMFHGLAREMVGQLGEAAWAHEWAVRAFSAAAGANNPETVRARANLARTYAALHRPRDAEPLLDEVIPFFEAQGNESDLAVAMNALGLVRQSQGRHTEALSCFERALALFEKLRGPDFIECATVLRNLATSAEASGDQVASRRALKRAEKIRRQA